MIWGISCLHFCKKSADHKEGNACSEVPIPFAIMMLYKGVRHEVVVKLYINQV